MFFVRVFFLLAAITGTLTLNVPQGRLLRKEREPKGAENPFLISLGFDSTQVSVMSQPGWSLIHPGDSMTFASMESCDFIWKLNSTKFDDATLKKKVGPMVKVINRYLANAGINLKVSVSSLVDFWTPTESQLEATTATDNSIPSMDNGIAPLEFTKDCGIALSSLLFSAIFFVVGIAVPINPAAGSLKEGIKDFVEQVVVSIRQNKEIQEILLRLTRGTVSEQAIELSSLFIQLFKVVFIAVAVLKIADAVDLGVAIKDFVDVNDRDKCFE